MRILETLIYVKKAPFVLFLSDIIRKFFKSFFTPPLPFLYLAVELDRQPLYPHTIAHILTKLEAKYGFKHVSCHGLRHTYCSLLLSQNVPIQTVSKYMGHSDSTVTLEVYSHFIPDTQEKVVFALNNISKK